MRRAGLAALLLVFAASARAAVLPQPGPVDPHIQTVEYDPQQVTILRVALNYALTLEFSPDERIENVSVGDGAVWQVAANKSADRLFVKPTQPSGETDMTVVTDTRIYVFELQASPSPDASMAYIVKFHYPVAPQAPPVEEAGTVVYRFSGAWDIRPLSMSDDGQFTTITWPARTAFPAVSLIDGGKETLANGAVRDGRMVIDGIASQFVFREAGKTAFAERRIVKPRRP